MGPCEWDCVNEEWDRVTEDWDCVTRKDTVDSTPFHSGTGCYGRNGEYSEYYYTISHNDHQHSLPESSLGEEGRSSIK